MTHAAPMIAVRDLVKRYRMGDRDVDVVKGVSFEIASGELISIVGPSGSGKSTVMNILGCLDTPSAGGYALAGRAVERLSDDELSEVRARHIGFVFQRFCLIRYLSVLENVTLALEYQNVELDDATTRARAMLERVHLGHRLGHRPAQLSGGECQRVAIARALVNRPELIDLFHELNRDLGVTIVTVTHSPEVAARTQRTLEIRDGVLK
jgi:putative ABC transport system ATP-binding protein